jgi:pyrroloquinoline quinone biosynthesis protein D
MSLVGEWNQAGVTPALAARARLHMDRVTGEVVLLYPDGVLLLNASASAVLKLCDGSRTLTEVIATLAARYETTAEAVSVDVTEFLERLRDRGLLHLEAREDSP